MRSGELGNVEESDKVTDESSEFRIFACYPFLLTTVSIKIIINIFFFSHCVTLFFFGLQ